MHGGLVITALHYKLTGTKNKYILQICYLITM